jgi:hypothetical protein
MALNYTTIALLQKEIIANLDNMTVIRPFANHKYEGQLKQQGDTVTVQSLGDVTWNRGGVAGAAITAGTLTVSTFSLTVNECDQVNIPVANIDEVRYNRQAQADISSRMAEGLAQIMDKYTAQLAVINATTKNTTAVTLTTANVFSTFARLKTDLVKKNVKLGGVGVFISPEIENWLVQADEFDANEGGLEVRKNGYIGKISGLKIYTTNNAPHRKTLTLPTIPVAGDSIQLGGVTFNFVAAGAAAAAGDVAIGANVAACQVNLVNAIRGTGTAGATTYIAVSAANRLILKNLFVDCDLAFSAANVLRIYSANTLTTVETITPADGVISADAVIMFAMDTEAVNVVDQMTRMDSRDITNGFTTNLLGEYVYGGAVLGRNADRIATYDVANG